MQALKMSDHVWTFSTNMEWSYCSSKLRRNTVRNWCVTLWSDPKMDRKKIRHCTTTLFFFYKGWTKISSTHHPLVLSKFYTLISLIFFAKTLIPYFSPTGIYIVGPYEGSSLISRKIWVLTIPYFSEILSTHHFIPYKGIPYKKSVKGQ